MKKKIYLFAAAALAMASCSEEDFVQQSNTGQLQKMEITASMPDGDSRTSFTDGGIKWQANDALSVFLGGGKNYKFVIADGVGENTATFAGEAQIGSNPNNVAYYPYAEDVTIASTTNGAYNISATFPTKQTWAADGSFGPNSLPMVAVNAASESEFQFKPLGGWLQLYVKGDTKITKVVMKAQGKKIAGKYTVTAAEEKTPAMTMAEDAVSYIALDCGEGVQLKTDEATLFTFAVAPFDFQAGEVSFDLYDNVGKYMPNAYVISKGGTVIANAYYTISAGAPINYVGIEPPLKVGNVAFTTMEEALDAALQMDEAEIVFGADVELAQPMTISEGKEITLKLGDYSLSVAEDATEAPIVNNGTLNLVGGTVDNNSAKVITNNGTMTIDGTTIIAEKVSGIESYENSTLTIEDANITAYESVVRALGATITIKDGVYKQTGTAVGSTPETKRYCVDARWNNSVQATVTIDGGEFETNNGLFNVGSDVIINGGKFTSEIEQAMTRHMFYTYAPLIINDGEFYGVANSAAGGCFICMASSTADVTINGGKFTSLWSTESANNIIEYYATGGKHEITGGYFNTNKGITSYVKENTDEATKTTYPYVGKPCVAKINNVNYETLDAALAVATDGAVINIVEGEFDLPGNLNVNGSSKTITLKGAGKDKTNLKGLPHPTGSQPGNYAWNLDLKFEDVTYTTANAGYSGGFAHASNIEFTNCKVVGQYYAMAPKGKFTNCEIDPLTGYLYTYASDLDFEGCTFNVSNGKALQVYDDDGSAVRTVNINKCTFSTTVQATTWDGKPVTPIDINCNGSAKFTVNINECTSTGFPTGLNSGNSLWNVKNTEGDITVIVDNVKVWPDYGYEEVSEGVFNVWNAKGLLHFADQKLSDVTLNITKDIDMENAEMKAIAAAYGKTLTVNGNNKTIKNVKVVSGANDNTTGQASLFYTYTGSILTIENLKVDGIEVDADINGTGYAAAIVGYAEGKVILNNVDVNNADVYGEKSCGALVGFISASSSLVEITNCDVTESKVEAKEDRTGAYVGRSVGVTKITSCTVDDEFQSIAADGWNNKYIGQRYDTCTSLTIDGKEYVDANYGLNNAIANATEGATILVAGDTYEGEIDLTQKNLNLVAFDGTPVFNGLVWADNCTVTLKGFKLSNPEGVQHPNPTNSQYYTTINNQYPLVGAYNFAHITMEECTFDLTGSTVFGFYGYAHNTPVFKNCTFNCNKIRPIASNGPALTVTGCTFNDQYHYSARIYENSEEKQTIVFTGNTIQGSNDMGEFEGINISKKGQTATVLGDFTIKNNTEVKYRHHKNVTMSESCTYDTDIANFAFEKEQ